MVNRTPQKGVTLGFQDSCRKQRKWPVQEGNSPKPASEGKEIRKLLRKCHPSRFLHESRGAGRIHGPGSSWAHGSGCPAATGQGRLLGARVPRPSHLTMETSPPRTPGNLPAAAGMGPRGRGQGARLWRVHLPSSGPPSWLRMPTPAPRERRGSGWGLGHREANVTCGSRLVFNSRQRRG